MKTFFSVLSLSICVIILSFCIGAFNAYFYPLCYKEQIEICSKDYGVKGALVASIANVESNFKEKALSNKGAVGVMQLMPATAEWLAGKIGIDYDKEMLLNGEYNIKLGAYYLSYLIDYFQNEKLGVCAYNAGQGNVSAWLKNKEYSKDGKYLDKIPFEETKNYIIKVYKNYKYYKNQYK